MFDMSAFMGKFIEEAKDRLQKLSAGILLLEKQPDDKEAIKGVMREAHTLKGSSKMMGLDNVNRVSHIMEDLMVAISDGRMAVTPVIVDILFDAVDVLANLVEKASSSDQTEIDTAPICKRLSDALEGKAVEGGRAATTPVTPPAAASENIAVAEPSVSPAAEPVATARPPQQAQPESSPAQAPVKKAEETVRVGLDKIDRMANLTAELITDSVRVHDFGKALSEIIRQMERHRRGHAAGHAETEGLIGTLTPLLQELADKHGGFSIHLSHVVGELRDQVMGIRMLPLSTVFDTYPRAVRNLSREMGKSVEFIVEGGETSLDKRVIEEIGDPLIHLVRNSVDHGVESPEQRTAAGKPEKGTIKLSAAQRGDRIIIQLEDDGKGIDPAIIRNAAVRKGFLTEVDAARLSDNDAINLIFMPGFSSKSTVSDISGRGVGMDVVKTTAEKLGGMVSVSSEVGRGSRFTVELPLTVAVLRVLLVECAGNTFAVPVSSIEQIIALKTSDIFVVEGKEMFYHEGNALPLAYLRDVLGMTGEGPQTEEAPTALIIRGDNEKKVGLMVENLGDDCEIVIKELGDYLGRVRTVSAATVMPDGRVVMIVDVPEIFRATGRARVQERRQTPDTRSSRRSAKTILVAEDSLLVRELERDVLLAAGYEVVTAIDGRDAREKLQKQGFDLLLTDIEMPGMDGLELTRQVRADDRLKELPVIVMTSLDSPENRVQGMEAGADAYIVKKEFDQQDLLETVKRLIR